MFYHFILFIFLDFAFLQVYGNTTSACDHGDVSLILLDVAMEIIAKAKHNIPVSRTSCPSIITKPIDCEEVLCNGHSETGIYTVWPRSRVSEEKSLQVYCDMGTNGGGWTVIQRRGDFGRAQDYFFKDWKSYKKGFGDIDKDFWIGNDNIFALTSQRLYSIRFDLQAVDGGARYALYDIFWIDDEDHEYALHIKNYSGNAGDSMISHHDNVKFTTKDVDNDNQKDKNCALLFKGGWWYNSCHISNLNGLYLKGHHESFADGVHWKSWKHYNESLEFTEMKIRSNNFRNRVESEDTPKEP